ncbi:DUF4097 family beta strand repeat-containing protein [Nonomuraea fastidiosa]|uniref:DUF4097 family beta strand repeat-containing protein n=1 Tax=Nonomuraea TaxID=83681 RepID=UPI00325160F2
MRSAWLVAGAVATVIALTLSTVTLWRVFAQARTPRDVTLRSIPFDGDSVRVKAGKGQVALSVLPGKAGELLVERSLRWDRDRPKVTEDWNPASGTLLLDAVCPGSDQPDGPLCQADYTLFLPPETDLEASTRGGRITVHELFGDVRLTSVSGDVDVREVSGDVWARTGTGSVDADGLTGKKADVEVGSGDVELMFAVTPSQVKAVVRTSGNVAVNVPPQARAGTDGAHAYNVTVSGTNTTVDVPQREDAKRTIVATTEDGIVTVCCQ